MCYNFLGDEMINNNNIRKIDLFYTFTSIAVTVIRNQKIEYCSYELKSIDGLGIYNKIRDMKFSSSSVQLVTYNSMECYGIFLLPIEQKSSMVIVGPILTVRPSAKENFAYLSFAHLFGEDMIRKYIHMIPLMPIGDFSNALSMFLYQMNEEYYCCEDILQNKVDLHFFLSDDEFTNRISLEAPKINPMEHVHENIERYVEIIRFGNLRKLDELFKEQALFHQFTEGNKKTSLYNMISLATIFSRAAMDGGLEFTETSAVSNTFISLAETFEDPNDFIVTFKKMTHGFTNQVHEAQNKYKYTKSIRKAMSYIDRHIHFPLSLDTVSKSIGLSRPYLSQLFSKEVGTSIQNYIQEKKMAEAENFVKFTKMSMSEIATTLSFCSQSYFTEVFKRYIGQTPVQYRKHHLKQ